jgi:four helix bundle protein
MPTFGDLRVWDLAYKMSLAVYRVTRSFPKEELYGLTSQMRRSAVSVGANIAEGQKRRTRKDVANFVTISEGSLAELQHYLMLARDLDLIDDDTYGNLCGQSNEVEKMLVGLQRSLRSQD